ncbi:MAG: hypothetical protein L3J01_03220 [Thiomicrorhabdus sp.]|nr:hypothetical protein [Thiomicrorhabdus sp.]
MIICTPLLAGIGFLPQHAVSAELAVISSLASVTTLGSPFDSTLLQGYLDLDRQRTQKTILSGIKSVGQPTEWRLPLIGKNDHSLPFRLNNEQAKLEVRFDGVSVQNVIHWSTENVSLDDLGVTFPNTFLSDFSKEEKRITFNPLPAFAFPVHLALPAISQVPVQSNTPSFLSLVMLSLGGVALLGWLRTKRQKQRIYTGSHSKV